VMAKAELREFVPQDSVPGEDVPEQTFGGV
jgi:hypothetical protein